MNLAKSHRFDRWIRRTGLAGLGALALSAALAFAAPQAAAAACRFALFACLQPAIGSLIFLLIHRTTGGQWGEPLSEFLSAGVKLLPWIWPLIAILILVPAAYPDGARPALGHGAAVSGVGLSALAARAAAYEGIFVVLRRLSLAEGGRPYCGAGLLLLVFTLHFLVADCFFALEPGWTSTAFPLVWMSIQAVAGLCLAVGAAASAGSDPSQPGSAGRPVGRDWGDLILTSVIFSSYLAFAQFLIVWSGNLPNEISWYLRRSSPPWRAVAIGLALFHLAFPAAFMMSRRVKSGARAVPRIAWLLCGIEIAWAAWFILPPFGDRGGLLPLLCLSCLIAFGGLFANRYLAAVRLKRSPDLSPSRP